MECKECGYVLLNIPKEDQNYVLTKTHTEIEIQVIFWNKIKGLAD